MSIRGPSSWIPTIDEFIAHWQQVDAELTPDPHLLPSGYSLVDLEADRTTLAAAFATVEDYINVWEAARTTRDNLKEPVRTRMKQLGNYIRGALPGSEYVGAIPALVRFDDSAGDWYRAMDDTEKLWTRLNADPPAGFTPPLQLIGAYTVANYTTDLTAMRAALKAVTDSLKDVDVFRQKRNAVFLPIENELGFYRGSLLAIFGEDHPLVLSIPRLRPLPGHTPDPVVLTGEWNSVTQKADLSWSASEDEDLDHYEIRACNLEPYDTELEFVVDSVGAETTTFSTNEGLGFPGATRSYKVYVVLTTDNEKGSNSVQVVNPGISPPPEE